MSSLPPLPPGFQRDKPEPVQYVRVAPPPGFVLDVPEQDGSLSINNMARSVATGVPIIGGVLNRLDAATNATLAPLIDPLLPDSFEKLPGDWQARYNRALDIQNGMDKAFHAEHPYVDTGLNIAGGVAATIPAMVAAPAVFGAGTSGPAANALISGATGATLGGTDAAIRSDGDLKSTAWGTGTGLVLGALGPVLGPAAGKGVKSLVDVGRRFSAARIAQMEPRALKYLWRAVDADGLDAAGMRQRLADMGPDAMPVDLGPNLQAQAGTLAAKGGKPQQVIGTALADRQAGATGRINTTLDENFGRARVPSELDAEIAANQAAQTQAMPGINEMDAPLAELARQRDALVRGQQVLDSGRTAPRPAELAAEIEQGALPQGAQIGPSAVPLRLSQGARADIDRIVGNNANDIAELNRLIKGGGDWNRAKLSSLFGPEKADRVFKVLENEQVFADTAKAVTKSREAAAGAAAQNEFSSANAGGFSLKPLRKAGGLRDAARSFVVDKAESVIKALLPDSEGAAQNSLATALVGQNSDAVVRALAVLESPSRAAALASPVVKALLLSGGSGRAQ